MGSVLFFGLLGCVTLDEPNSISKRIAKENINKKMGKKRVNRKEKKEEILKKDEKVKDQGTCFRQGI